MESEKEVLNRMYSFHKANGKSRHYYTYIQTCKAMTEYASPLHARIAELEAEVSNLDKMKAKEYNFDCWKSDGKITTKTIKACSESDAIALFEYKFPYHNYDKPY